MSDNSVSLHRVLKASPEKIFRAFTEPDAIEFLKYTDTFDDPNLPGEITNSIWLKKVMVGTEIKILQEGIPAAIPAEMCYLGWQESLEKLARLVEPEIPDA